MWAWLPTRLPVMMLLLCAQITDRGADIKLLPDTEPALGSWLLPPLWWITNHESLLHGKWTPDDLKSPAYTAQPFIEKVREIFFVTNMFCLSSCCGNCATYLHYEPLDIDFSICSILPSALTSLGAEMHQAAHCSCPLMCDAQFYR